MSGNILVEKGISENMMQNYEMDDRNEMLLGLTTQLVSAYVSNNSVRSSELSSLIAEIYESLNNIGAPITSIDAVVEAPKPAIHPKKSVHHDYIICLEDGKHFKSLKRHLMAHYNMTPEQYRAKWNLEDDYPMVAPAYAEKRSELARTIGLGRKAKG
jgi:predicted transcriptional regulator